VWSKEQSPRAQLGEGWGGMQACEGLEDFGHDAHMRGRRAGCSTYLMSGAALI
jgi:hypothetical protein